MANKLRGEVTLQLCGRNYELRPTFEALCELENRTGLSMIGIISSMEMGAVRLNDLALIVWAGMYGFDKEKAPSVEEVGEMILKEGLVKVINQEDKDGDNPVSTFLVNGILGGEKPDDPKKQVGAKKRPRKT